MYKFVSIFFVSLFLLSCHNRNGRGDLVAISVPGEAETLFEDIVAEYDIVKLETTNSSYLSVIDKIKIFRDEIYILDTRIGRTGRLLVFDKNGKFQRSIGRVGRGPGEYLKLYNFEIDHGTNELLLVDVGGEKVMVFSLDGTFKNYVSFEELPTNITRLHNGNFVLMYGAGHFQRNENYVLAISDPQGNILSRHIKNEGGLDFGISAWNSLISAYDGSVYFMPQFSNTIYSVSRKNKVMPVAEFQFSSGVVGLNDIVESEIDDGMAYFDFIKGKNYMISEIMCNDRYICALNRDGVYAEWIIWDRIDEKVRRVNNPLLGYPSYLDEKDEFWVPVSEYLFHIDNPNMLIQKLKASWNEGENPLLIRYRLANH